MYTIVTDDNHEYYVIPLKRFEDWDNWVFSEDWEQGLVPSYAIYLPSLDSIRIKDFEVTS